MSARVAGESALQIRVSALNAKSPVKAFYGSGLSGKKVIEATIFRRPVWLAAPVLQEARRREATSPCPCAATSDRSAGSGS